eukprot:TRINITY_DN549_c0_g1_i6.p1 TRINITY_DN549_c0_g1~~TRINITY_DN549_c0_g1_i6.p1  ORF type:complete len:196 (+),score=16.44 TRINITY_DN549_c0_g1_i6:132-719(+)
MSGPTSPRAYLREQAGLAGSHFLSLDGYDAKALTALLDLSAEWKEWRRAGGLQNKANVHTRQPLLSRSVATLFEKKSTRTRVSVETACSLLGGHALFLGKDDIHLGKGESLRDTGNVLGRMNDVVCIYYGTSSPFLFCPSSTVLTPPFFHLAYAPIWLDIRSCLCALDLDRAGQVCQYTRCQWSIRTDTPYAGAS